MHTDVSIQVHAWHFVNNGDCQEHCCESEHTPDGWSVYTRVETPDDPSQPFNIFSEEDFDTKAEAFAEAERRSKEGGFRVEYY